MKGNHKALAQILTTCVGARRPLFIVGHPGIGKSSVPRQMVDDLNASDPQPEGSLPAWGYRALDCYLFDPVDLRGFNVPDMAARKTISIPLDKWPLKADADAGRIPKRGILVLEEMASAHPDMVRALAEPVLEHSVNGVPLAPGWSIVATSNKLSHKCGVQPMANHVANRLVWFELEPDWESWQTWAIGEGIRPELVGHFALTSGATLFQYDVKAIEPNTPYLTPRSAHILSDMLTAFAQMYDNAPAPLFIYQSAVGERAGAELFATTRWVDQLERWDHILANPVGAKVPTEPGAIYSQIVVLAGGVRALGDDIRPKVSAAVGKYISRLPAELAVATHNRIVLSNEHWGSTPEYATLFNEKLGVL
jgi:hypothetical protein